MNKRFLSVIVFAILVAGAASLVIYRMIQGRLSAGPRQQTTEIFVAARNLSTGVLVRDVDVKTAPWTGALPPGTVLKKEDLIGRGVVASIYESEPILESRLAPKGAGAGLAVLIPKGMRAVAVRVNEVVGVAGFVLPGMRVDVLISGVAPGANRFEAGAQTRTILQNIEVLSAGHNIQKDNEGKPITVEVVNLLVTPEQAEKLSLASNDAKIQLVLRNPMDNEQVKTDGIALAALFGRPAPPPPPAGAVKPRPRPAPPVKKAVEPPARGQVMTVKVVEVLSGGKRSETKFEQPSEVAQ